MELLKKMPFAITALSLLFTAACASVKAGDRVSLNGTVRGTMPYSSNSLAGMDSSITKCTFPKGTYTVLGESSTPDGEVIELQTMDVLGMPCVAWISMANSAVKPLSSRK